MGKAPRRMLWLALSHTKRPRLDGSLYDIHLLLLDQPSLPLEHVSEVGVVRSALHLQGLERLVAREMGAERPRT